MSKTIPEPILPCPPRPGYLRICPHCAKWFALEFVESTDDPDYGKLKTYRCKSCEQVTVFASRLPKDAW